MIDVFKDDTDERKENKKMIGEPSRLALLPGSFEFELQKENYVWNPKTRKETDKTVSEDKHTPIAVF